ncbi:MAG TPA: hypothetical protein VFA45_17225 [Actinomycetes bacterium]|jgi:K(+)-stimulated pyrophosphate-energized sodium pump|nr:hypothetical protein [Actinomycetes bacterium]
MRRDATVFLAAPAAQPLAAGAAPAQSTVDPADGALRMVLRAAATLILLLAAAIPAAAASPQEAAHTGRGEASLVLPDLGAAELLGMNGRTLLMWGLLVCILGLVFGLVNYIRVKRLPVHPAMRDISQLIWETCKTYLFTQGKFLLILEILIGKLVELAERADTVRESLQMAKSFLAG